MAKKKKLSAHFVKFYSLPAFEKSMANSLEIHGFHGKTKKCMAYLQTD